MNKYQLLFIIDIDTTEEVRSELVDKFSQLIADMGGEVSAIDKWGVKKFAYSINYKRRLLCFD